MSRMTYFPLVAVHSTIATIDSNLQDRKISINRVPKEIRPSQNVNSVLCKHEEEENQLTIIMINLTAKK